MKYPAIITKEGKYALAEFPDCPGCVTQADPGEDIAEQAQEALEAWLESHMVGQDVPPVPTKSGIAANLAGHRIIWVRVPNLLAIKVAIRQARVAKGITQTELGRLSGLTQSQVARLEGPDSNPTFATLEKVCRVLGRHLDVVADDAEAPSQRRAAR